MFMKYVLIRKGNHFIVFLKIKLSKKKITDEFKPIMDVSSFLEDDLFNTYPEKAMQLIFAELNKK